MEQKKKRSPNYSVREKEVLLSLVAKFKNVIENKKTDSVTVSEKNQTWFKITEQFNAVSPNNVFRMTESLKKYYENLKEDLRKRAGEERKSTYKTGGGPPSPKTIKDDDVLLSLINKKTIFGLENPHDSDYIEPNIDNQNFLNLKEVCASGKDTGSAPEERSESSSSVPPVIEVIYDEPEIQKENNDTCFGIGGRANNGNSEGNSDNWSKVKPDKLKRPLNNILKKNIDMINSTKGQVQKQGKRIVTRRRPSTIRVLTSSALAEKYNILIEKKIELAECLKKEHDMRMKILSFDLALRKKELSNAGYTDVDIQLLESCEVML